MSNAPFVSRLNNQYFNSKLSSAFQQELATLPVDRPDVYEFIERMFRLMQKGGHPATDLSVLQGNILGSLLARIMPGAWEGRIPPITVSGRHQGIDEFLSSTRLLSDGPKRMLDLGCGFPPSTTIESAARFTDWEVIGADPSLPVYLVYDEEGNYCTFDENRQAVYFQPAIPSVENWNALLSDSSATRSRFSKLLDELLGSGREFSDDELPRLRIDPVHRHSTSNLSFATGGIGNLDSDPVDVIRCFNVLMYFNDEFHGKALDWFGNKLSPGGLLVAGSDWAFSTEARFMVYQKEGDDLNLKEFVFGLDNLAPVAIVTWYTLQNDDREVKQLAEYLSILRKDRDFIDRFYAFHDQSRVRNGICPRGSDGYYGNIDSSLNPVELWTRVAGMHTELKNSGLVEQAADVLSKAGFNARRNENGYIAVAP